MLCQSVSEVPCKSWPFCNPPVNGHASRHERATRHSFMQNKYDVGGDELTALIGRRFGGDAEAKPDQYHRTHSLNLPLCH